MLRSLRSRLAAGGHALHGAVAAGVTAAALLTLAPGARADDNPLVPLLTGGTLTYSGQADRLDTHVWKSIPYSPPAIAADYTGTRKGHADFETSWLIEGRYPGIPQAQPLLMELVESWDWKQDLGNGSYTRTQVVTAAGQVTSNTRACAWDIVMRAPSLAYPLDGTGRAWQLDPMLEREEVETDCGPNETPDDMFVGFDDPLEQLYRLPDEPAKQRKAESAVALNRSKDCGTAPGVTVESCADTIAGTGKLTFECAVCVQELTFEHPDLPGGAWIDLPGDGTFDGNRVRVTAKLHNPTKKAVESPVALRDMTHRRDLPTEDLPRTVSLAPGQTIEVRGVIDTSGLAWEDGPGKATYEHELAFVSAYGGGQKILKVKPKPAILVHGWNSSAGAWSTFPSYLKAHSEHWKAWAVAGMDTSPTGTRSIFDNAAVVAREVRAQRESLNADHVDLIAHSMGGLISRAYIHREVGNALDGKPWVSHLIQLGTPNRGSVCANLIYAAASGRPTLELMPGYVDEAFNRSVTNRKGVPFSVLVGVAMPKTCYQEEWGDSVVSISSARWEIGDAVSHGILHTSMTGDAGVFNGFVAPRIEVGPGGKAEAKARRAIGKVSLQDFHFVVQNGRIAGDRQRHAAGGLEAAGARSATRAPAAKTPAAPQVVATFARQLGARTTATLSVPAERSTTVGAVILAPAGSTSELLDARGKVAASVQTGQAGELLRSLSSKSKARGAWKVRVTTGDTGGLVAISGTVAGSKAKLAATTKLDKKGRLTVTAKASGMPGAKVTAQLRSAGGGKPARLSLRRKGGRYVGTTKGLIATEGLGVIVTAKAAGVTRVVTAAAG